MRLPNNYGSISKLSGKRRKPYMILIHCDKDEYGKRTRKPLSYHTTYKEAFEALKKYNEKPYDLTKKKPTFEDVYKLWHEPHCKNKSESLLRAYAAAYKSLEPIQSMTFDEIRPYHYESVFNNFVASKSKKHHMTTLLKQLYKYAMKLEIVEKDYSQFVDAGEVNESEARTAYSDLEVKRISKLTGLVPDCLMIMFYTGFRISELLSLETANVDFDAMTFRGGIKTEAGKNRLVPIHPTILPLVLKYYDAKCKYLISKSDTPYPYIDFLNKFKKFAKDNNFDHTIHEARHTFITNLDRVNAKDHLVKLLVGHAQKDFTKKVYTHSTVDQLKETIMLLSGF